MIYPVDGPLAGANLLGWKVDGFIQRINRFVYKFWLQKTASAQCNFIVFDNFHQIKIIKIIKEL